MRERTNHNAMLVVAVFITFVSYSSCKPDAGNPDADSSAGDADADSDVDGDGDTDADGDGDTDADLDTIRDTDWDGICDAVAFDISLITPDMLIVLDRSYSMEQLGHWDPVRESIYSVTDALEEMIWFGLMVFPNIEGETACDGTANNCVPGENPIVECAEGAAGDIHDALVDMEACGGTPIASTLNAASGYLETLATTTGHPSYVVLATDGAPNCNTSLDGDTCRCTAPGDMCQRTSANCLDDVRTYTVIESLRESGIGLFVIGITASEWRDVLDEMANRGGTGVAFMADDSAGIQSSFEEITGVVATCEFEMGSPDPSADPDLVNFYFDDTVVPMDADGNCSEGWIWVDEAHTRVRFCGPHCDQLQAHTVSEVRATFGCPTLI